MDKDSIIFNNVTFSDILKDIYDNSSSKRKKIDLLLDDLKNLVKNVNDAVLVVPLIKEYLEVAVKNDEQLVKISSVIQKLMVSKSSDSDGVLLSDEEKDQLLLDIKSTNKTDENNNDQLDILEDKSKKIKSEINA